MKAKECLREAQLTPYTTTLTTVADRHGVSVSFIHSDPDWPIFELSKGGHRIRCFNALTDEVGAATFHLLNNKQACHAWLVSMKIPVPQQMRYVAENHAEAVAFLKKHAPIVVKPCMQWGGRGVAMGVRTPKELVEAVRRARRYEPDIVLEETVRGEDLRVILVDGSVVAAICRTPASVVGDGEHTVQQLIALKNAKRRKIDPSNIIPWDAETRNNLRELGIKPSFVPSQGRPVRVRLTNNYHTGGDVELVFRIPVRAQRIAEQIADDLQIPLVAVDFLIDRETKHMHVIEVSPDMAISPPEGEIVAEAFMEALFPEGE